ncbi:MAG: HEAT repeat domain-containing protein [Candidatus Micrarchaeia archaeon]
MPPKEIQPMKPGHPQYERFQSAVEKLSHPEAYIREEGVETIDRIGHPAGIKPLEKALNEPYTAVRWKIVQAIGKIGHPDGIKPLIEKAINYELDGTTREYAAKAINAIIEAIKDEQPEHHAVIARQHINPIDNPKAFSKFYESLAKGEHRGQPPAWLTTTAKQLKALEGNLK